MVTMENKIRRLLKEGKPTENLEYLGDYCRSGGSHREF